MAILDYDDELTTAGGQTVTVTAIGTRVKNGTVAKDWGAGSPLFAYLRVPTAFASGDGATGMQVDLVAAANATLDSGAVVLSTRTIPIASLGENAVLELPPLMSGVRKQYLGIKFTPVGGTFNAGKVKAGLIENSAKVADGLNFM